VRKNIKEVYVYVGWHLPKKEKPKKALIPLSASEYSNLSLLSTFTKTKKDLA
jgi:hypothetical protein